MTEAEAKTKWCPFMQVHGETTMMRPMTNREEVVGMVNQGVVTRCIASACAAWRWHEPQIGDGGGHPTERRGFCGIAGRP